MISTREAAKRLKLQARTLSRYLQAGKLPAPKMFTSGKMTVHLWTEAEIERAKMLLPKIANGRKTRYQKLRKKQGTQAGTPALQRTKKPKKKSKP